MAATFGTRAPNYLQTRFKQNRPTKGSALSLTPNASDGFVYADEYVNWLKSNFSDTNLIFDLDNEPDLWQYTHAEVHPNPVTYAEIVKRSTDYATAIKSVWPTAKVAGAVNYGFYGYETLQAAPGPRPIETPGLALSTVGQEGGWGAPWATQPPLTPGRSREGWGSSPRLR